MWQLVPWLPKFHWMAGEAFPSSFGELVALVKGLAVCVDCAGAFGGVGLSQAVYAYNLSDGSESENLMRPARGIRLTDMSYPYMVLRTNELPPGLAARLRTTRAPTVRRAGRVIASVSVVRVRWPSHPRGDV